MVKNINYYLTKFFSLEIIRAKPRESVKFAKNYFKNKKIVVVEIGILAGENSKEILSFLNVEKDYLIDPYTQYDDYKNDKNYKNIIQAEKLAKKRLKNYSKKIVWIRDYSEKASKLIPNNIDFIYIDGNHEYEYVKKDLEKYWPKIKNGGILSGHDIQYPGVSKAVIEFAKKMNLEVLFGDRRDWWIIKNE